MEKIATLLSATLLTLAAGQALAASVTVAAYVEYPNDGGTAIGTGTGELLNGVLTYEMEYVIDIAILTPATLDIYGTIYNAGGTIYNDGVLVPHGTSAVSACVGNSFVCERAVLGELRADTFVTGGPLSETEITILTTGTSASGNTPPSIMTITPVATVPIPAAVWLFGSALLGLAGAKRRKVSQ